MKSYVQKNRINYDAVLVLGLDDVKTVRQYFPAAKILYWIHNISAICKKEYLYNVNKADYFLSPSRTTYQLLLRKLQPVPLTAEFYFLPNWCEEVFKQANTSLSNTLKKKHALFSDSIVFIFSGSDLKLKGKFIIEKVIKKLATKQNRELIFFFAGSDENKGEYKIGNIRVINVGLLPPHLLAAYYHISLFGCFPSLAYDHCPLTLLEMVHCNVLPIASDIGGVKEILGNEYKFLVNEPHSVCAWINTILKTIFLSCEERSNYINTLKERVIKTYNKEASVKVIEDIMTFE